MLKNNSTITLTFLATLLSILLALTLAAIMLGTYGDSVQHYINSLIPRTLSGALTFALILTPAMAIGLPRQIAALSAGFIFGASYGLMLAMLSAVLGCAITLIVARKLLAKLVERNYPKPLAKVSSFFNHNTFLKILIIRLLPAGSNFLTNILAGTARSPFKPYMLGSALGFIPQMTVFSLMGAGLQVNGQQQLIISIGLLVIATLLGYYLYKKTRHSRYHYD